MLNDALDETMWSRTSTIFNGVIFDPGPFHLDHYSSNNCILPLHEPTSSSVASPLILPSDSPITPPTLHYSLMHYLCPPPTTRSVLTRLVLASVATIDARFCAEANNPQLLTSTTPVAASYSSPVDHLVISSSVHLYIC